LKAAIPQEGANMLERYLIVKKEEESETDCRIIFAESEADALEKFRMSLQKSGFYAKYSLLHENVLEIADGQTKFKAVRLKKYAIKDDIGMNSPHLPIIFAKNEYEALTTYMNTLDAPIGGETGIIGITDVFQDGRPRLIMGYGSQFIATPVTEETDKAETEGKSLGSILE
jgi:hypothetical protein